MQAQINMIIPNGSKHTLGEIFGYSTRGIPGLEVVGLGKRGRLLKEKLNFVNKRADIRVPAKRYVICIDNEIIEKIEHKSFRWLELPTLLLYWSLAEIIQVSNLDMCLCGGTLSTSGEIKSFHMTKSDADFFYPLFDRGYKLIAPQNQQSQNILCLSELIDTRLKVLNSESV